MKFWIPALILCSVFTTACGEDECTDAASITVTGNDRKESNGEGLCTTAEIGGVATKLELEEIDSFSVAVEYIEMPFTLRVIEVENLFAAENIGQPIVFNKATVSTRDGTGTNGGSITITSLNRETREIDLKFQFTLVSTRGPNGEVSGTIKNLKIPYDLSMRN